MRHPSKRQLQTDFANEVFIQQLELDNQHPAETHIGLSDMDMLSRLVFASKPTSTFFDEADYSHCLYQIMIRNYDTIYENITEKENKERIHVQIIDSMPRYSITQLITSEVREVTTNHVTAILEYDDESPYGVQLITIYPDSDDPHVTVTEKDLFPLLKQTDGYLRTNTLRRLYFEITCGKTVPYGIYNLRIRRHLDTDNIVFEIPDKDYPNRKIRAEITYHHTKWFNITKENNGKYSYHKMSRSDRIEFCLKEPQFNNYIGSLEQRLAKIKQEINIDRQRYQQQLNNKTKLTTG